MPATGRCLCGGVRYRTDAELRPVINCHCERCRRVTGHHMAATGCAFSAVEFDADDTLRWYEPAAGVFYGFCSSCGSTLFWRTDDPTDWLSIAAGTVDQPTGLATAEAWYVAEAGDYHRLDPTIVCHATEPRPRPLPLAELDADGGCEGGGAGFTAPC